jgi:CheY-like chemotaxis protein
MTSGAGSASGRPAKILIVDDELLNVDYLEQELEGQGFVTESALNGLEALERVAADPPDLVLLDVMMPELDGISALRVLKQDPETRLIPVVLMTALNAVEDRVKGIEAGADDFLTKPVDDRELMARIRTALALRRVIDETVVELQSTSEHLERYGRQRRDVSVLAVDWRLRDPTLPRHAVTFVGRRQRDAAREVIEVYGGTPNEGDDELLVAVFDGSNARRRAITAVDAALAVLAEAAGDDETKPLAGVALSAAVTAGPTVVGSTRVEAGGRAEWVFGATGEPVERASALAQGAPWAGVLVSEGVAAEVSDCFELQAIDGGSFRVLGRATDEAGHPQIDPDRRIETVVITDVVGSTSTVERVGDRVGGELLAAHEEVFRSELVLFGGEELDTAGDSFLAAFDSPARAIRCLFAVLARTAELGLALRAGVHTGELERLEGKPRGIALHIAARIAARAAPGEILVSGTTRELAAGGGLLFADRGVHTLRGVAEPRQLFAALGGPSPPGEPEEDRP